MFKRSSTGSAADSRTAARECEAADIIAHGAPGAVIKVARRTAFHVLRHDAEGTVCMAVELRIAGNVLGVGCVPSRRSDRCTWSGRTLDRDGKKAWCQVRPARRRVHGWATPTRSRPEQCIPAAHLIRSGPRCSCGDGLLPAVVFAATWLHVGERRPARASQRQAVKRSPGTRHEVVAAGRESRGTPKRWPSRSALPIGLHRKMTLLYTMCTNYSPTLSRTYKGAGRVWARGSAGCASPRVFWRHSFCMGLVGGGERVPE